MLGVVIQFYPGQIATESVLQETDYHLKGCPPTFLCISVFLIKGAGCHNNKHYMNQQINNKDNIGLRGPFRRQFNPIYR